MLLTTYVMKTQQFKNVMKDELRNRITVVFYNDSRSLWRRQIKLIEQ